MDSYVKSPRNLKKNCQPSGSSYEFLPTSLQTPASDFESLLLLDEELVNPTPCSSSPCALLINIHSQNYRNELFQEFQSFREHPLPYYCGQEVHEEHYSLQYKTNTYTCKSTWWFVFVWAINPRNVPNFLPQYSHLKWRATWWEISVFSSSNSRSH